MLAGLLHDIGKVYIPERILNKPGRLSREEMAHIRKHPLHGWDLCHEGGIKSDVVLDGVLSHHERVDGTGYPHALNHHKLSEIAKIVAIADTFDAMSSHRVYRPAVSPFRVMEEIFDEMFKRLDSKLCYMFLDYVKEQMTGSEVVLSSGGRARLVYIDGIGRYRTILQDLSTERCFWEDQPGQCVLELA
jgi:HD-GYP domain-containing protein (c-di-GMP phosphodiesterase class II)